MPSTTKAKPTTSFCNLVIRASAGTGKTFQLSNRYLMLLERGVPPEQILATTFTRKAAGEILERIVTRLARAAQSADDRRALSKFLECEPLSADRCRSLLQDLLRNLHRLRICTLDSLFGQIARATSLETGLPPGWEIIDELEEQSLRDAAIAAVLQQESTAELVRLAHLLAKGETQRGVGQLVRQTVSELHSLFQETDAKAWHCIPHHKPLEDAEIARLVEQLRQVVFSHKGAMKAVETDCERILANDWDGFAEGGLACKVMAGELTYFSKPIPDEALRIYQRLLEQCRAVVVNRIAMQTEGSYELLHKFDTNRRRLQEERSGLRFDDITHYLDMALRRAEPDGKKSKDSNAGNQADANHLLFRLDGGISHLLLDEFQDTSPRQWRVLLPFVERASQGNQTSSFFCVGDAKQAIYGWRGGVAEIFDAIEDHVPEVARRGLAQSFRSSPPVIETVNQVFSGIGKHSMFDQFTGALEGWRRQIEEHSTARMDLPGYVCLRAAAAPDDCESVEQAVWNDAASLVQRLVQSAPDRSIGVLVRTNDTVAAMIHALRHQHVSASEEGGNPLTDSAAVQLILSLLRLADHPGDKVARFHIATSPLAKNAQLSSHEDGAAARRLSSEIRAQLMLDGYGRTIQRWCDLVREHVGSRDRLRLRQLVEMAYLFQARATLRTDDFIRHAEYRRVADPSRATVRVMTVHQAKGLEFDIVVLPELDFLMTGQRPTFVAERIRPTAPVSRVCRYANVKVRQLLPKSIQRMFESYANQEISESLCVLYVALTRAAQALYMVIAPSKDNERSLPRTFAGLLRASLTDGAPVKQDSVVFEAGDRNWIKKTPQKETPPPIKPATQSRTSVPAKRGQDPANGEQQPSIRLAPSDRRLRGLQRVSPSSLEGGAVLKLEKAFEPESELSKLRGTVLHGWFQEIEWLEDGLACDDELKAIANEVLGSRPESKLVPEWLKDFHQILDREPIRKHLSRTAYKDRAGCQPIVQNERTFAVPDETGLLAGSIDRLVLLSKNDRIVAADIIDFKTDQLAEGNKRAWQARVEFYRPQLEAYRRAVGSMLNLPAEKISARLLFVASGQLVEM